MPCTIRILTPDGLIPANYHAESLNEAAQYEPRDGVYTVTNTFEPTKVLRLDAHFDRLEDSARRANIPLKLDRDRLRAALRQVILEAGYGDVRFRVTVPADAPDRFVISVEPFKPLSPELIANGVKCMTAPNSARRNAAAKTTGWMHERAALEASQPPGIYTTLLLDERGLILEGLSSNFYALLDGELRMAGEGVLPGIAQGIVLEIAPAVIPIRRDAVLVDDLPRLSEAFITSSSRGIVPVVEIDGIAIGSGLPGAITWALRERYQAWMRDHLEDL
jgi:branched-chain amino acid aminotransferase